MSVPFDTELKIAITKTKVLIWEANRRIKVIELEIHDQHNKIWCLQLTYNDLANQPVGAKAHIPKGRMFVEINFKKMLENVRRSIEGMKMRIIELEEQKRVLNDEIQEYSCRVSTLQKIKR